ncbi:DUF1294 domain-containing protein [Alisedimentitalea sp. MJ-SS2]|uniref:DUF1294 domain-containing protein n=1 Tax=Aliisedimentitalea sp. MJ-SS2 TaxID=3049795 RepID=UPI00290855FA|nr:DUF1294 domain-containing protein [Alisedimentitalea sp. MJ-SS2]MDU8929248.1 DUF1294 domain-containing protein [Alisedimentitalea sp. MJ-SS2]
MLNAVFWLVGLFVAVNVITVALFWHDKRRAQKQGWRVQEMTLHVWTLLGGTPAAFWASQRFRHKTRKQPFRRIQQGIALLQLVVVGLCLWQGAAVPQVLESLGEMLPRVIG